MRSHHSMVSGRSEVAQRNILPPHEAVWVAHIGAEEARAIQALDPAAQITSVEVLSNPRELSLISDLSPSSPKRLRCLNLDVQGHAELAEHFVRSNELGCERLLRAPALTGTRFAAECFRTYDGICFWPSRADEQATWFVYWGSHVWRFAEAFGPHGPVLLRGRGCTGPWGTKR
ncbi:MAG: hypothetical protein JWN04_3426 [Myxococcaceae bacterium]|nr:hypothetical protein [Myxococcaceae bacterium]